MTRSPLTSSGPKLSDVLRQAAVGSAANCVFALVDGAVLRDLPEHAQRTWPASKARSLLTGRTGVGAAEVGPLLFRLSQHDLDDGLPATLLDAAAGRSAGSFLISTLVLDEHSTQLMPFVDVKLADESTMVMRFFDPRVLPLWLALVLPNYSSRLAAALTHWVYWDARLNLKVERFEKSTVDQGTADLPLRLSAPQEQYLMDACYPYMTLPPKNVVLS